MEDVKVTVHREAPGFLDGLHEFIVENHRPGISYITGEIAGERIVTNPISTERLDDSSAVESAKNEVVAFARFEYARHTGEAA